MRRSTRREAANQLIAQAINSWLRDRAEATSWYIYTIYTRSTSLLQATIVSALFGKPVAGTKAIPQSWSLGFVIVSFTSHYLTYSSAKVTADRLPFQDFYNIIEYTYALKLVPHPHDSVALGLLKVNPLLLRPSIQSTSIPRR